MESYKLDSKIIEENKEYLIQTINDPKGGIIKTSLFLNGELLDSSILPHDDKMRESDLLNLVKTTHVDRKSELEYLLKSFKDVISGGKSEIMYHLGAALLNRRMYSQAKQLFQSAIKQRPDYHEAYFLLAQSELASGRIDAAVKAGVKAVELQSQFADYRNLLGEIYLEAGSCKRAVIELEEAIKRNIYYADAYFNLAIAYILNAINREDFEMYPDLASRTTDMLKKAILIDPSYKTSAYEEAIASLASGQLKRACTLLKAVREEKKEIFRQEKSARSNRFLMNGEGISYSSIIENVDRLEKEIDRNPGYVDLYNELAICYLHQARFCWQRGIDCYRKALEINSQLPKTRRSLDLTEEYLLKLNDTIHDITEEQS